MRKVVRIANTMSPDDRDYNKIYAGIDPHGTVCIAIPADGYQGDRFEFAMISESTENAAGVTVGDGWTGCGNETLESLLKRYCEKDDWGGVFEFDTAHEFFEWAAKVTA